MPQLSGVAPPECLRSLHPEPHELPLLRPSISTPPCGRRFRPWPTSKTCRSPRPSPSKVILLGLLTGSAGYMRKQLCHRNSPVESGRGTCGHCATPRSCHAFLARGAFVPSQPRKPFLKPSRSDPTLLSSYGDDSIAMNRPLYNHASSPLAEVVRISGERPNPPSWGIQVWAWAGTMAWFWQMGQKPGST